MNKIYLFFLTLLYSQTFLFSQVVDLGTVANFVLFTSSGAIDNTGASIYTGDIGTDFGIVSMPGATVIGAINSQDSVTALAKIDLLSAYDQLMCIQTTVLGHTPVFGLGETITKGVYSIAAAGSLAADITLNGQGDTNAVFILKFGAAFNIGAASTIILSNGTRACNVFFIAEGAIGIGAASTVIGNFISHNGAIAMGASGNLDGRLLCVIGGAIAFGPSNAIVPSGLTTATCTPVDLQCGEINAGTTESFVLFANAGAVTNIDSSHLEGNIGSNAGAINGFEFTELIGGTYSNDLITAQVQIDLNLLYNQLVLIPPTNSAHAPAFGGNEVLTPGVYAGIAAGSLAGNLTLDGQGDINSVFIFIFNGALSVGAMSQIFLINRIRACNVFWVAEGAITISDACLMKGTFISNTGSVTFGSGGSLDGHLFARAGAISINNVNAIKTPNCECFDPALPIELLSFSGECNNQNVLFKWITATEHNNDYFSIEHSIDGLNWENIRNIPGAGNSTSEITYNYIDFNRYNNISYYRLKQTDYDGQTKVYSPIAVKKCFEMNELLSIAPNPAIDQININYKGDIDQVLSTSIYDVFGKLVYFQKGYFSTIPVENIQEGIYYLHVVLEAGIIVRKFCVNNKNY